MWTRISSGKSARGQGGGGVPSIAGGAGSIFSPAYLAMSCFIVCGGPSREWWAGLGTVAAALEEFGFVCFEYEGGKCLFLYF